MYSEILFLLLMHSFDRAFTQLNVYADHPNETFRFDFLLNHSTKFHCTFVIMYGYEIKF